MKIYNLNIDALLGKDSPSDYESPSQKAVKTYVDSSVSNVLPSKTDNEGKYLKVSSDGSTLEWSEIDTEKTYHRRTETISADTTTPPSFTISEGFTTCAVYLDGVLAVEGTTYTVSGYTITFKDNLLAGAVVDIIWYTAFNVGTLPIASQTALGVVKVGDDLSVTSDGTLSGTSLDTLNSAILTLIEQYK